MVILEWRIERFGADSQFLLGCDVHPHLQEKPETFL